MRRLGWIGSLFLLLVPACDGADRNVLTHEREIGEECAIEECGEPPIVALEGCVPDLRCQSAEDGRCAWVDLSVCPEPQPCGGIAGIACPEGLFCFFAPGDLCGGADDQGLCLPPPEACTEEWAPVCGCDGETYSNGCFANAAGVSVLRDGECEPTCPALVPPPEDFCPAGSEIRAVINDAGCVIGYECVAVEYCGGFGGGGCGEGEYCDYPLDAVCGAADAGGVCRPVPEACIEVYAPVCGCDGVTHPNSCFASAAGVAVLHEGACADDCPVIVQVVPDCEDGYSPEPIYDDAGCVTGYECQPIPVCG